LPNELERLFGDAADEASRWWPDVPQVAHGACERSPLFAALPSPWQASFAGEAKLWPEGSFRDERVCRDDEALAAVLRERATAKIEGVERQIPEVARALDELREALGGPIRRRWANLYLSPAGVGVGEHADGHEVIVVQLAGSKRWSYRYGGEETTVVLRPGSVLFLPRAVRHSTEATELSVSLSLSFACYTLAEIATTGLQRLMSSRPEWARAAGALDGGSHSARLEELDGMLKALGAELAAEGLAAFTPPAEQLDL
jgi:ribosomal protein L16 Arg81 hydroxylase